MCYSPPLAPPLMPQWTLMHPPSRGIDLHCKEGPQVFYRFPFVSLSDFALCLPPKAFFLCCTPPDLSICHQPSSSVHLSSVYVDALEFLLKYLLSRNHSLFTTEPLLTVIKIHRSFRQHFRALWSPWPYFYLLIHSSHSWPEEEPSSEWLGQ